MTKIDKLLRAVKARADVERARLAAIDCKRRELLAEAENLRCSARRALDETEGATGGDLLIYGRAQTALERAADQRAGRADALLDHKKVQEGALRTALRHELGWGRIAEATEDDRRKAAELAQEEAREAVGRIRPTR